MFDDFDTQIQCEEFYSEPSELDIEAGYYEDIYTDEDAGMDDYEWQLWLRRQRELAELKEERFRLMQQYQREVMNITPAQATRFPYPPAFVSLRE